MSVRFDYTRKQLETMAQLALDNAKSVGASAAAVEV